MEIFSISFCLKFEGNKWLLGFTNSKVQIVFLKTKEKKSEFVMDRKSFPEGSKTIFGTKTFFDNMEFEIDYNN